MSGWIAVDLDGTLAEYGKFQGHGHIGAPVPAMLERVKRWVAAGLEVRIFTARVGGTNYVEKVEAAEAIRDWCEKHIGQRLEVTCTKDYQMRVLYDDRAVAVEKNTGRLLGGDQAVDGLGLSPRLGPVRGGAVVVSCNRHEDCSRAPKGQLCCFDPKCDRVDCQPGRTKHEDDPRR